jgi:hypothetical protein
VAESATVFTGLDSQNGTESTEERIVPVTMTFTKFYCAGVIPNASTKDVFTVKINGASQTGTCAINEAGPATEKATVSIEVKAGQLIDVEVKNGHKAAGAVSWGLAP